MVYLSPVHNSLFISKHTTSVNTKASLLHGAFWEVINIPAFWGFIVPALAQVLVFNRRLLSVRLEKSSLKRRGHHFRYRFACSFFYSLRTLRMFIENFRLALTWNITAAVSNVIHGQYMHAFLFRRDVRVSPFHALRPLHPLKQWMQWRVRLQFKRFRGADSVWQRRDLVRMLGLPLKPLRQRYVSII